MSIIIAGRFREQSEIDDAMEDLMQENLARERIASFYLNPPGQHDLYKMGGDHAMSPGAKESDKGAAIGVAAGAATGVAATAFLGPLGAVTGGLVGAYVGGLIGGLSKMKERGETGKHGEDPENAMPTRSAGLMLAVEVEPEQVDRVVALLAARGAQDIERAEGRIVERDWIDFDPVSPPNPVPNPPRNLPSTEPHQRM